MLLRIRLVFLLFFQQEHGETHCYRFSALCFPVAKIPENQIKFYATINYNYFFHHKNYSISPHFPHICSYKWLLASAAVSSVQYLYSFFLWMSFQGTHCFRCCWD